MIVIRFQTTTTAKAARRRQNELPKRNKRVMLGNKFLMRSPGGIRDASGLSSPRSSLKFMMRTISTWRAFMKALKFYLSEMFKLKSIKSSQTKKLFATRKLLRQMGKLDKALRSSWALTKFIHKYFSRSIRLQKSKNACSVWRCMCVRRKKKPKNTLFIICLSMLNDYGNEVNISFSFLPRKRLNKDLCWPKPRAMHFGKSREHGLQATRQNAYENRKEQNWLCRFHATKPR